MNGVWTSTSLKVAVAGSILERVSSVRLAMEETLHRQYPGVELLLRASDPCAGALWNARHRPSTPTNR